MSETIHAGCLLVGEAGILIRGPSGSGKSSLARALIGLAHERGLFARLVGDDRIVLKRQGGRLVARPAAALQGLMEVRGHGLARTEHENAAVVRLVVDCHPEFLPRYPEESDRWTRIEQLELPRLGVKVGPETPSIVLTGLGFIRPSTYYTTVP